MHSGPLLTTPGNLPLSSLYVTWSLTLTSLDKNIPAERSSRNSPFLWNLWRVDFSSEFVAIL